MRTITTLTLALGLTAFASAAHAQTSTSDQPSAAPRFTVSANVGFQAGSPDLSTSTQFEVFEEPASLTTAGELSSGFVFDFGLTYRYSERLGFGAAFSRFASDTDVEVVAQVPHPVFTDRIRTATATEPSIDHSQSAIHLQAVWMIPFTTEMDFSVSAGPSIVFTSQQVVTAAALAPEEPPFDNPSIQSVTVSDESKTSLGFNIGADATYLFSPRYGAGVTARYVWASADIEGLTDSLTVGGFQILGGIRIRF
jgi:hypothetical protein